MKTKALVVGGIAVTAALAGGWALAQTAGPGSHGFAPPFMHGKGSERMGPGMMNHMGKGMGPGMKGMMKGHGMGPGMMHGGAGLAFTDPTQIEALKTELGITAAQEPAWADYAKGVQDAAAAMKTAREGVDRDAVSRMSPSDRFAFASKKREHAQKQFEGVRTAATVLLATLDERQKAKATDILPGLGGFGLGMMRGDGADGCEHRY